MKSKTMKEKEPKTVFGKRNYIILLAGFLLIIVGYITMSGEGRTLPAYNADIFSKSRIGTAPILCLLGYLLNIFGILYRPKRDRPT